MAEPDGTTTWIYDVHNRVTSKQQSKGAVTLTTSATYSASTGLLTSMTYPSGVTLSYSYDAVGPVNAISAGSSLISQVTYRPFTTTPMAWMFGNGAAYSRAF